jgi:hypothetical protein
MILQATSNIAVRGCPSEQEREKDVSAREKDVSANQRPADGGHF